ncbi:MAG: methanogenesis marker radical SAM protein [Candidatus Methanolliviera sp. GoM_asphalt]|nr:MAG: methanogenesis marker radical SAM protein [Candidatus Methanolliviera sp. GoM_asphalt]
MKDILADVGGRPGIDCRGFCRYCYFKGVKGEEPLGCKYCPPSKRGCDYCTDKVREKYFGFIPLNIVLGAVYTDFKFSGGETIVISGGGDLSCYSDLLELTKGLTKIGLPIHINYTSGKGFDNEDGGEADSLVKNNISEVSFTVFSTDRALRREWMNDKSPDASLANLKRFCESSDVYAASIVIPGVNDGEDLYNTCSDLEDMGIKGMILMRFANYREQGLILGNDPIIEGIDPHSVGDFRELVTEINKEFSFRVTGTPLWDPEIGSPYTIRREDEILRELPKIEREATILTGKISAPFLSEIFDKISDKIEVAPVDKDIGCLITIEDIKKLSLDDIKETVIFPGRAFVHDREIEELLCRDGVKRLIIRGPDRLTADGEMSISMSREEVLEEEKRALEELIRMINFYGV